MRILNSIKNTIAFINIPNSLPCRAFQTHANNYANIFANNYYMLNNYGHPYSRTTI